MPRELQPTHGEMDAERSLNQAAIQRAVSAERERCAKICDEYARTHTTTRKGEGASICASLIRNSH